MTDKRETIFITGAGGFLGARLAERFRGGYRVLTASHSELDISDGAAARRFVERARPDYVLHCAAVSDTGVCQKNPELSRRVNVEGTVNLAGACREYGGRFIFMSSDQIYSGSPCGEPGREAGETCPVNVYGRDKKRAEEEVLSILPDAVCLRLTWLYDFPVRGRRTNRNLLCSVLSALVQDRPLKLPVFDFRGITWAGEVVEQMDGAMRLPGGVYNFGSENHRNTFETGRSLLRLLAPHREGLLERDEESFRDAPRNLRMDTGKIRAAGLSFSSTEEGFRKCLESNPEYRKAIFI